MAYENVSTVAFSSSSSKREVPMISPSSMMEEGIPVPSGAPPARSSRLARPTSITRNLSATSKMYDIDGDGHLDETERVMRDMDKEGRGYLTNDKVYNILREQLRMQKQLLLAKRLLIVFAALLVFLAVANIGVAFAAASMAKDTSTQNSVLVVKETGRVVATSNHADIYGITTATNEQRRALDVTAIGVTDDLSITTIPATDALAMYNECNQGGSVTLRRTWPDFPTLEDFITLCPANYYSSVNNTKYHYSLTNGKTVSMLCHSGTDYCTVSGSGLKQLAGESCVTMGDCLDGSWCMNADAATGKPGTCQLSSGVPGCWAHVDCITNYCSPSQAYGEVGTCTCNPTTAEGCQPGKTCFTSMDITDAQGLAGAFPTCYFTDGDACSSYDECLTQSCVDCVCQGGARDL